jgi:hypothetical protein
MRKLVVFSLLLILAIQSVAQPQIDPQPPSERQEVKKKDHLNFFVISKRKKHKLDLATRFNVLRTKIQGFFHPNTLISVIAEDREDAIKKVRRNLESTNAELGTIWFDSHGAYKTGYALFHIGKDECNSQTLSDSAFSEPFKQLCPFVTKETKVIIGSCYGGATYERSSVDYKDTFRMDGDSLMMAIGRVFREASIYACESWVMSKPGLFHRKPAAGGNPGRKLFLDVCYRPAWENIGVWNEFNSGNQTFSKTNTVSLDPFGNLVIRGEPYIMEKHFRDDLIKRLRKLQPGLYK